MKKYSTVKSAWLVLIVTALFAGCQKNASYIGQTEAIRLSAYLAGTASDSVYRLTVNNTVISDSLYTGSATTTIIARSGDGHEKLILSNRRTGAIVMDTSVSIPEKIHSIVFLQLDATKPPVLFNKPDVEVPETARQVAFLCNDVNLPETFGVRLFAIYEDGSYDTIAIYDQVKQGQLSVFKEIELGANANGSVQNSRYIQLTDAATGEPLPNMLRPFDPAVPRGDPISFTSAQERWIIFSIKARVAGGKKLITAGAMAAF